MGVIPVKNMTKTKASSVDLIIKFPLPFTRRFDRDVWVRLFLAGCAEFVLSIFLGRKRDVHTLEEGRSGSSGALIVVVTAAGREKEGTHESIR